MPDPDTPVIMTKIVPFEEQEQMKTQTATKAEKKKEKKSEKKAEKKQKAKESEDKSLDKSASSKKENKKATEAADSNMLIPFDHGKHNRGFSWVEPGDGNLAPYDFGKTDRGFNFTGNDDYIDNGDHQVSWANVSDALKNGRITAGDSEEHTVHEYRSDMGHQFQHLAEPIKHWAHPDFQAMPAFDYGGADHHVYQPPHHH